MPHGALVPQQNPVRTTLCARLPSGVRLMMSHSSTTSLGVVVVTGAFHICGCAVYMPLTAAGTVPRSTAFTTARQPDSMLAGPRGQAMSLRMHLPCRTPSQAYVQEGSENCGSEERDHWWHHREAVKLAQNTDDQAAVAAAKRANCCQHLLALVHNMWCSAMVACRAELVGNHSQLGFCGLFSSMRANCRVQHTTGRYTSCPAHSMALSVGA